MKLTLAAAATILLASQASATLTTTVDELRTDFASHIKTHNKVYDSEEYERRFQQYRKNKQFVDAHNANAEHSFTLSVDGPFGDWSNEEYRSHLKASGSKKQTEALATFEASKSAPSSWDWRNTKNIVNPVKNQGSCGSCWAFSAVATIEGAWNQKHGSLTSLSEQQVVDCTNNGANTCSLGGEMYQGVDYVAKAGGIESESSYPYTASSGRGCKYTKSKAVAHVSGYHNITSGDENALKSAVYEKPIISVGIDASSFWFQLYSGGVYDHSSCGKTYDDLDHGVAVVGYGSSSKDYWIVRNSWGESWGMSGYIQMSRNKDNQCGIATQACYAVL